MADIDLTITGLQEAQAANIRRISMLGRGGPLYNLLRRSTVFAHSEAVKVTHVDTGALRASHRIEVTGIRGQVFIDQSATNPQSGARVRDYAGIEEARGGSHAFYGIARPRAEVFMLRQVKTFVARLEKA